MSSNLHKQLLSYYLLTEARNVAREFDEFIAEVSDIVCEELKNQMYVNIYDDEPKFTGWRYDPDNKRVVKTNKNIYHPIYIQYVDEPETLALFFVPERETFGKTDEELETDEILICVNLAIVDMKRRELSWCIQMVPELLGHELVHVKQMWRFKRSYIPDSDKAYNYVTDDFLKAHGITTKIDDEDKRAIFNALYFMSSAENEAICNGARQFLKTHDRNEILQVIGSVNKPEDKAATFIEHYQKEIYFGLEFADNFVRQLSSSLFEKQKTTLGVLFAQYCIYFGFIDDATGCIKKEISIWSYTNDLLTTNKKLSLKDEENILNAYKYFAEKRAKYIYYLMQTVVDVLEEENFIKDSQIYESNISLSSWHVLSKSKVKFSSRYFGLPKLYFGNGNDGSTISRLRSEFVKIDSVLYDESMPFVDYMSLPKSKYGSPFLIL